jgi:hypothetical protein
VSEKGRSRRLSLGGFLAVAAACLLVLSVYRATPNTPRVHGDGYYTYLWSRSIAFDGDLDFANDYTTCTDPWGMLSMPHGIAMNQWSPGSAIFFAPVLLWARLTGDPALSSADPITANACLGGLAEQAVMGSVFAGILALVLAFLASRRLASDGVAAFAALLMLLAGPVGYYATMLLSYGHAASAALGGLAVWAWMREQFRGEKTTTRGWLLMGFTLGLAMLARPQNAIFVVLPLWQWVRTAPWRNALEKAGAERFKPLAKHALWGIAFVSCMLVGFALQLYQWWSTTGEVLLVPQGDYYLRPESPHIANLLFSSANGLFTWCPVAYPAVLGLVMLTWRARTRHIGAPLLLLFVVCTALNACVADWWGGVGFAARRYDAMTVPFAIGVAAFVTEARDWARRFGHAGTGAIGAAGMLLIAMGLLTQRSVGNGFRSDIAQPSSVPWTHATGQVSVVQTHLWEAVGNPLAWPASIPFALRHRVHPRLWDEASTPEFFFHRWLTLEAQADLTTLDIVDAHPALALGFTSRETTPEGTYRFVSGEGRVLLPISYPYVGSLRLAVFARGSEVQAHFFLDEEDLGTHPVSQGGSLITLPVRAPHQGITELRVVVDEGELGLSEIELRDRTPAPSEAQARRNAMLRERRIAWRAAHGLYVP